jgi:hypothetical protein
MSNRELTEYLYCDEKRLDSYFSRISGPIAYDKVPVWKAALSLTGPTVEGTQSRPGRPFTLHEKVQKLIDYLRSSDLIDYGRPTDPFGPDEGHFRVETMLARKAIIRPKIEVPDFRGLSLWVSVEPDTVVSGTSGYPAGPLFLLEDFRGDDDVPVVRFSSYSWLTLLAESVDTSFRKSIEAGISHLTEGLGPQFASGPIEQLSRLGAVFAPERRIAALYKVRAGCNAQELSLAVATVGYPVVITTEGGVLGRRT